MASGANNGSSCSVQLCNVWELLALLLYSVLPVLLPRGLRLFVPGYRIEDTSRKGAHATPYALIEETPELSRR